MEAELMALAAAGATTLVQQMATDGWNRARDRMAAFFAARGSTSPEAVASDLDTARTELVAARQENDEETATDLQAEWRARLRRTLRTDPQAAAELRALLDELAPERPAQQIRDVHNTINGGTYNAPVVLAGMIRKGPDGRP
ncbi:hypothetical protein [Streptomyces sp. NPDC088725]|uniref:hypothetical protein n=1 Tax=Streptomyces sp. NPDC088725 TaxID=3365873 RepID=UPI0038121405